LLANQLHYFLCNFLSVHFSSCFFIGGYLLINFSSLSSTLFQPFV
jgi:hypothetical protein